MTPSPSSPTLPAVSSRSAGRLLVVFFSYLIFAVLGMADGMIGVAFPSMRSEFKLPLDAFGTLFIAMTAGFLLSSFVVGRVLTRFPVAFAFGTAMVVRALALLGYVLAPSWTWIAVAAFVQGLGSGILDGGLNTWFAMRFSPRLMNWLHACFGLGATLGPLALAAVTSFGFGWRGGYALMSLLQGLMVIVVLSTRPLWDVAPTLGTQPGAPTPEQKRPTSVTVAQTLVKPAVWLGIAVFFFYTGVELTAGNWSFTLLTEARNVPVAMATFWTSLYWASFTAGRVFFGFISTGRSITVLLRICLLTALLGVILLTWSPLPWIGILGLVTIGFAVAPVFPLLVSETPMRLGAAHAQHAIGFQVGAAAAGIAVLPSLAGVLAERTSLEIIPVFLIVINVVLIVLHELMVRGHIAEPELRHN